MWDNRENKKNPKGPDYTCKDAKCKFVQDPATKEWSVGAFKTGVWDKKPFVRPENLPAGTKMVANPAGDGFVPAQKAQSEPQPALVKEEPDWEKITEGKVRHGVICAMLQAGASKEQILEDYEMWTRLIIIGSPI